MRYACGISAVLLGVLLFLMAFPCAGQPTTQLRTQTKKLGLKPVQRLARAVQASQENDPLFGVVMHTIQRGLSLPAGQRNTPLDKAFDEALKRHPGINRQVLQQLVQDYQQLPPQIRAKLSPAGVNLDRIDQPINLQTLRLSPGVASTQRFEMPRVRAVDITKSPPPDVLRRLYPNQFWVLSTPYVRSIQPARGGQGYDPGQTITLQGKNFESDKTRNSVVVFKEMAGGSFGELTRLTPTVCSPTAIELSLPSNLAPGRYLLRVDCTRSNGKVEQGNLVMLPVRQPPPPAPVIQSISPSAQYAGKKVLINGANFLAQTGYAWVWFKPMDGQSLLVSETSCPAAPGEPTVRTNARILNATQMELTLPATLLPGHYMVVTQTGGGSTSNWVECEIRPFRYKVNFLDIHCKDESDPEWAGGDEIVTAWVIMADEMAWSKSTGEYTGFDDGDTKNYNPADRSVFLPGAGGGEVKQALAISTTVFEWDAGDAKAASDVIGFIGDLAANILKAFKMEGIAAVIKMITPLIQKLVAWLGGNPDNLGTRTLAWSALDLLELTNSPQRRYIGELNFDNSDDDGSYRLRYEILRIE